MSGRGSILTVSVPKGFDLRRAVCSYGYFLLAPNRWDPAAATLNRPFRGREDRVVHTAITQPRAGLIRVACAIRVDRPEASMIRSQIRRMLRVDENLDAWYRLCPAARRVRFGRLFRSPTLFEDIVKTITGCNVTWPNTMRMNDLLCQQIGDGAFPTPGQLAATRVDTLKKRCKVGYRAPRIVQLARQVVRGDLDLQWFEDPAHTDDELFIQLKQIHGIGDYAASNICHLLGRYHRVAIDTETYRHFRQAHGVPTPDNPKSIHPQIEAYYDRYAPYQFLAYWFELWTGYQARFGQAHHWSPEEHGSNFTASNLK